MDSEWNITSLIDLEFASVRPIQTVRGVPSWLSNHGVDELEGIALEEYDHLYHLFVDVLEEEEKARRLSTTYSERLRDAWKTGRLWYMASLNSLNAFPTVWEQHLQPRFFEKFEIQGEGMVLARLWGGEKDVRGFIRGKVEDNEIYRERIREIFKEKGERRMV